MLNQFSFYELVIWLILLILGLISQLVFILVLFHFKTLLRSIDIGLAGLITRNLFNCLIALPIILAVNWNSFVWSKASCSIVIFCLHSSFIVSVLMTAFFAVDRLFLLRKDGGPVYNGWFTNKVKPILLCSVWACSFLVIGLVPILLWVRFNQPSGTSSCLFLPSQLDYSYSLVLITFCLASSFISGICAFDGWTFLRAISAPTRSGSIPEDTLRRSSQYEVRKHAWESWRVTTIVNAIIFFCNHLPLMIIDFNTLLFSTSYVYFGSPYLWLILIEGLLLPNSLWIFSTRYRHVLVRYFHKLTSNGGEEIEDKYCAMQMFQKRCTLMGSVYRGHKSRSTNGDNGDSQSVKSSVVTATIVSNKAGKLNNAFNTFNEDYIRNRTENKTTESKFNINPASVGSGEEDRSTTSNNNEMVCHENSLRPISSGEIVTATVVKHTNEFDNDMFDQTFLDNFVMDKDDKQHRIDSEIISSSDETEIKEDNHSLTDSFYLTDEEIKKLAKTTNEHLQQNNRRSVEIIPIMVTDSRSRHNSNKELAEFNNTANSSNEWTANFADEDFDSKSTTISSFNKFVIVQDIQFDDDVFHRDNKESLWLQNIPPATDTTDMKNTFSNELDGYL